MLFRSHEWHRYSLDSVYPDSGKYFFSTLDESKWLTYSSWHGASLKPWRANGNHILILCQRPNGFNMFTNQDMWLDNTIRKIRKYSQRPIMVRMHPGDGKRHAQISQIQQRHSTAVSISMHENIQDALTNCWCTVGLNSTPNVVAAIEGVPCYIEDRQHSWAADVAFTDLSLIENPPKIGRAHV